MFLDGAIKAAEAHVWTDEIDSHHRYAGKYSVYCCFLLVKPFYSYLFFKPFRCNSLKISHVQLKVFDFTVWSLRTDNKITLNDSFTIHCLCFMLNLDSIRYFVNEKESNMFLSKCYFLPLPALPRLNTLCSILGKKIQSCVMV